MTFFGSTFQLIIVWCALNVGAENVEIVTPENTKTVAEAPNVTTQPPDSYVKAYEEVQKLRSGPAKRNDYNDPQDKDKQGGYNTVIRSSYLSDDRYPPLTDHWAPMHAPAPPPETYGAPMHAPAPPPETYGAPHSHHFHEIAPPTHCHQIPYSSPSASFFGFLPKKLSLKLLLKILLKLVLFKMIVKFIAVICLLLFIPLLKVKGSADADGDERRRAKDLDDLTSLIWNVLEHKNSVYGDMEDEDVKDIKDIAGDDDEEEDNFFSGPLKAVRFLQFCVSAVDRVVGFILSSIKKQRYDEGEDLGSFVLEKLNDFVSRCLKLLDLRVPQVVDVREEATLRCKFDLGGDELYSVKWYKEELEFFRFMPDNSPRIQTFPVEGVHVDESKSNVTVITLSPLEYRSSGLYRCEVSSERPHFKTVYKSENMSVLGLPRGGPTIEGIKDVYFLGDYVTGNCTSSPSNPAAQIQWFINEKKAEDWLLEYYNPPKRREEFNLESRVLGLRFQVDLNHYQGKNQVLSLTCQSTVAGKTKTQRVNVQLSRMMTNQKFAQEQINGGNGRGPGALLVLLASFLCFFFIHLCRGRVYLL